MKGGKRERWLRLCLEAAEEQDSKRLLELVSEINHLLHEKHVRLTNVHREAGDTLSKLLTKRRDEPLAQ